MSVFHTVVGHSSSLDAFDKRHSVGREAMARNDVRLSWPVSFGWIRDIDDMERVWHHSFYNELRVVPEEQPILLTETASPTKQSREQTAEIMFEKFNVPSLYISIGPALAMYAAGRGTGVVLNVGDNVCHAIALFEGYSLPHATSRAQLAGDFVTTKLAGLLEKRGFAVSSSSTIRDLEFVRDLKEKVCIIPLPSSATSSISTSSILTNYSLPDGRMIAIDDEIRNCPDLLFNASAATDFSCATMQSMVDLCIRRCDADIQGPLYSNIVLSSATTKFPNFAQRFEHELRQIAPQQHRSKLRVIAPDERAQSIFVGGSILASLSTFDSMSVKRSEFDEVRILHSILICFL